MNLPGLKTEFLNSGNGMAKFDLTLQVFDTPDGLIANQSKLLKFRRSKRSVLSLARQHGNDFVFYPQREWESLAATRRVA